MTAKHTVPVCPHVQTVSYVDIDGHAGVVQGPPWDMQPDCEVCRKLLAHDDLLAAAQLALDWEEGRDCGECSILDVVAKLKAAIAKAKGTP